MLALCGASSRAFDENPCVKRLKNTISRLVVSPAKDSVAYQRTYWNEVKASNGRRLLVTGKNVALSIPRQQARYWKEILKGCGKGQPLSKCLGNGLHRIAFVERTPRDRLHWGKVLNPAVPFTLWPEVFHTRYQFSAPVELALSLPGLVVGYYAFDGWILHTVDTETQKNIPGAPYAFELAGEQLLTEDLISRYSGGRDPTMIAVHVLKKHVEDIEKWKGGGDPRYLRRLREFRALGVLPDAESEDKLNQLALRAYRETENERKPGGFADRLQDRLKDAILSDPVFSKYPPSRIALINLIFTPSLKVSGHSDIELLARGLGLKGENDPLSALQGVISGISMADFFKLAVEMDDHPKTVEKKREEWKRFSHQENLSSFANRPDLPEIDRMERPAFDEQGSGKNPRAMDDELSYWRLVWEDPRFQDIRKGFESSELSEIEALETTISRIRAYNEIYAFGRSGNKPSTRDLCSWIGAPQGPPPNVLVGEPATAYAQTIKKSRVLSASDEESCRIDIAEFFYHSYISEVGLESEQAHSPREIVESLNRLIEKCPSLPERRCPLSR